MPSASQQEKIQQKKRQAQKGKGKAKAVVAAPTVTVTNNVVFEAGVDADGKKNMIPIPKKEGTDREMGYSSSWVEAHWYQWWEKKGFFKPDSEACEKAADPSLPPFTMVIPPPNVTGRLHIGHGLTIAIEDCLVRFARMTGRKTLYLPGIDHAGIATQVVVEKQLKQADPSFDRHAYGRKNFIDRVWEWKAQYGADINDQLRTLGASLDWTRSVFTMDETRATAVTEAFVRMHDKGLIERKDRLVNWDCTLRTAISGIEVDHVETTGQEPLILTVPTPDGTKKPFEFGRMTYFRYEVYDKVDGEHMPMLEDDGSPVFVTIATTRLETMLGDVAVAVHSDREDTKKYIGKYARHPFRKDLDASNPFAAMEFIPFIVDNQLVKTDLGTGAVKITPAHDQNDFECGARHGCPVINILTDTGCMNGLCGEFANQFRYDARINIEAALVALGHFSHHDMHEMALGLSQRSHDIIEFIPKPQWYVNCQDMARDALIAVKVQRTDARGDEMRATQAELLASRPGRTPAWANSLNITPAVHEATWFRWLGSITPWCVSRQLWWGHQIPAYHTLEATEAERSWFVGRTAEEAQAKADAKFGRPTPLERDPDVLDTWFSSGLFPFSVFGWPTDTLDLSTFYPTSVLETGSDILFFWVARMVMMGLHLTDKLPFTDVLLHSMVRDAEGRKMSKSLGNVINPTDVINGITNAAMKAQIDGSTLSIEEKETATAGIDCTYPEGIPTCGTDALRFTLCNISSGTDDVKLNLKDLVASSHFCNKVWNAAIFMLGQLSAAKDFTPAESIAALAADPALRPHHRWILTQLADTIAKVTEAVQGSRLRDATDAVRDWWWRKFCDIFVELSKPDPATPHAALTLQVLHACLDVGLRLLQPFMPFLAEELWQRIPRLGEDARAGLETVMLARMPALTLEDPALLDAFDRVMDLKTECSKKGRGASFGALVSWEAGHDLPEWSFEYLRALCKYQSVEAGTSTEGITVKHRNAVIQVIRAGQTEEEKVAELAKQKQQATTSRGKTIKKLRKAATQIYGSITCSDDLPHVDAAVRPIIEGHVARAVEAAPAKMAAAVEGVAKAEEALAAVQGGEDKAVVTAEKKLKAAKAAVATAEKDQAKAAAKAAPQPANEAVDATKEERRHAMLASKSATAARFVAELDVSNDVLGDDWTVAYWA